MFSMFAAPIVDFVEVDYDKVTVRSGKRFTLGVEHKVRIRLKPDPKAPLYNFRVFAIWEKIAPPNQGSGWTYCFRMVDPKELPVQEQEESGRKQSRLDGRFRAISRDLPDFMGVTIDISESGVQIETRGPVEVGKVIDMRIEAEMSDWAFVAFRAKVMWCKPDKRSCLVGMRYEGLEEEARQRLTELSNFLHASKGADVMKRTLQGADQVLQKKESTDP